MWWKYSCHILSWPSWPYSKERWFSLKFKQKEKMFPLIHAPSLVFMSSSMFVVTHVSPAVGCNNTSVEPWDPGSITPSVKPFLCLPGFFQGVLVSSTHFCILLGLAVISVSILSHLWLIRSFFISRSGYVVKLEADVLGSCWVLCALNILRALTLLYAPAGASTPSHLPFASLLVFLSQCCRPWLTELCDQHQVNPAEEFCFLIIFQLT